jgi:hypothetical protein
MSESLVLAFDAAYPPAVAYPNTKAVFGYLGGNAVNVWSLADWLRFQHLVQFPTWVGAGEDSPEAHGINAVAAMHGRGWRPGDRNRRMIMLDFETEVDPSWIDTFASQIWRGGYQTGVYGSASTIVDNPPKEGRWIALYNGEKNLPDISGAIGHQFAADVPWESTQVDLSVVTTGMLAYGGLGARK